MTKNRITLLFFALLSVALSACVTQEFENDETPVVKNQANSDDMAATRISLGLGYLRMGNMAQAKQNLEKAKQFSPEMVQVYTAFAHYYETVGENELAVVSFEKALSLKSDDADTLNNYGVYLCRQDQLEAAEKQLLKAIAVPSYVLVAKSYENLSSCFLQKNNFAQAEIYLHKAVMHSPGKSSTLFQMVRLQYAMGNFAEAKIYEQRFEKITRRFTPQSLALAFKVYWKLGQRRTAKNYGAMLVTMHPQSWEAQQYLLNELELIEADSLAERYQLTQSSKTASTSKKRVVKLSPKKTLSNKVTNSAGVVGSTMANKKIIHPTAATSTTTNTTVAINTGLIMMRVEAEADTFISEDTQATASKASLSTNDQDKRVVVLVAPRTADVVALTEKEIQLEDQEIFQLAKKPEPIVEDEPIVEKSLTINTTENQQRDRVNHEQPEIHVVSAGDNLYGISIKYNIKIEALRRWNNLTGNKKIRINDKLNLTDPKTVTE